MESTGTISAATTEPTTEKPPATTALKMPPAGASMDETTELAFAPKRSIHSVVVWGTLMPWADNQGSADKISAEILPGNSLATVPTSLATPGNTKAMNVASEPNKQNK